MPSYVAIPSLFIAWITTLLRTNLLSIFCSTEAVSVYPKSYVFGAGVVKVSLVLICSTSLGNTYGITLLYLNKITIKLQPV